MTVGSIREKVVFTAVEQVTKHGIFGELSQVSAENMEKSRLFAY